MADVSPVRRRSCAVDRRTLFRRRNVLHARERLRTRQEPATRPRKTISPGCRPGNASASLNSATANGDRGRSRSCLAFAPGSPRINQRGPLSASSGPSRPSRSRSDCARAPRHDSLPRVNDNFKAIWGLRRAWVGLCSASHAAAVSAALRTRVRSLDFAGNGKTLVGRQNPVVRLAHGQEEHVLERILGHAVGTKIQRTYDRGLWLAQQRRVLEVWSRKLGTITAGGADVVALERRA